VLDRAEDYGLTPADAAMVRAGFAATFGDTELAERLLVEAVESDPSLVQGWVRLIRLLLDQGRNDDAIARADEALVHHPENDDLRFSRQFAAGDPAAAIRVFASRPGVSDDLRLAIERVENYDTRRETLTREERLTELTTLGQTFPQNAAVVKFVLRERISLGDDASSIAADSLAAVGRLGADTDLLRMAAAASFNAGRHADSLRVATQWRGLTQGAQLEPDLYAAQASQMMNDHVAVIALLRPYLDEATRQPDEPANANAIRLHARSELATRPAGPVRARLEPLASRSEAFRSTVWLDLASTAVTQPQDASDWLLAAERLGMAGNEIALAQAWMRAAARFPDRSEDFAVNAARIAGTLLNARPDDLPVVVTAAQAFQQWGEASAPQEASEPFDQAATLFVRAARLEPENLNYLFSAARCADDAGRPGDAEAHYRELLASPRASGLFQAAVRNNLAGILSRNNPTSQRLDESLALATQAVEFQSLAPFHGTRGWTLLGLDRISEARADFQQATQIDPGSFEAWAGLAAAQLRSPETQARAESSMDRARQLARGRKVPQELRSRLEPTGLTW
jgi:tetratricopeptide (TPR) repeat protein